MSNSFKPVLNQVSPKVQFKTKYLIFLLSPTPASDPRPPIWYLSLHLDAESSQCRLPTSLHLHRNNSTFPPHSPSPKNTLNHVKSKRKIKIYQFNQFLVSKIFYFTLPFSIIMMVDPHPYLLSPWPTSNFILLTKEWIIKFFFEIKIKNINAIFFLA